jgi:hypothetical protein
MSLTNPYGDFELTDPQAMRALAHPVRLAILDRLQRHGPATATQLSPHVGATPSVTSWHLRHLATFGLVEDWERGMTGGCMVEGHQARLPHLPASTTRVSRCPVLGQQMFLRYHHLPQDWLERDSPTSSLVAAESGLACTRVTIARRTPTGGGRDRKPPCPVRQRGAEGSPPGARGVR